MDDWIKNNENEYMEDECFQYIVDIIRSEREKVIGRMKQNSK